MNDAKTKCPVCNSPRDSKYRPFCSRKCGDIDLYRWFDGRYAISADENSLDFETSEGEEG